MFRPAEASYEKQASGLHGIVLMGTDFEPRGRSFKTGITSVIDAVDGCAGRPAEGRRCKSVTVKA